MKTKLVITDLTRMHYGRICIAGYNKDHCCVRPVLPPPGIPESALAQHGKPVIFPFALVEFNLLQPDPQPPHTEDYFFENESPRFVRRVENRLEVLRWSLFESVSAIFEQPIHSGPVIIRTAGSALRRHRPTPRSFPGDL
jgi:hypothetical protein